MYQGYQRFEAGDCPRYAALEGAWTGVGRILHAAGRDGFLNVTELKDSMLPERTACEFLGPNVAEGKEYILSHPYV